MRKPKDWGQPCPNPECSSYWLLNRGNGSAISTYLTQSGKRRIFRCSKYEGTFSETRDQVYGHCSPRKRPRECIPFL